MIQDTLVNARKDLGFEISYVHSVTGISTVVLEGFEAGNFDVVEPVFAKFALRTYAEFLRLDVEVLSSQLEIILSENEMSNTGELSKNEIVKYSKNWFRISLVIGVCSVFVASFLFIKAFFVSGEQTSSSSTFPVVKDITDHGRVENDFTQDVIQNDITSSILKRNGEMDSDGITIPKKIERKSISSVISVKTIQSDEIESINSSDNKKKGGEYPESVPRIVVTADSTTRQSTGYSDMRNHITNNVDRYESVINLAVEKQEIVLKDAGHLDSLSLVMRAIDTTLVRVEWDDSNYFEAMMLPDQLKRLSAVDSFFVHAGKPHGVLYYFDGALVTESEIGDPNRVLRFKADNRGVTILDSRLNSLRFFAKP